MEKTLYPKTSRIGTGEVKIEITEKLDGSNLGIFNLGGKLVIAQRNHVFFLDELTKENSYKGLIGWIEENKESLSFHDGSGVFGEWLGMGCISYGEGFKKYNIFAKANINEAFEVRNINYTRDFLKYPFSTSIIPECIGVVPKVGEVDTVSSGNLDDIYEQYSKEVGRTVEGFIINNGNSIMKYVRCKNGKPTIHKP